MISPWMCDHNTIYTCITSRTWDCSREVVLARVRTAGTETTLRPISGPRSKIDCDFVYIICLKLIFLYCLAIKQFILFLIIHGKLSSYTPTKSIKCLHLNQQEMFSKYQVEMFIGYFLCKPIDINFYNQIVHVMFIGLNIFLLYIHHIFILYYRSFFFFNRLVKQSNLFRLKIVIKDFVLNRKRFKETLNWKNQPVPNIDFFFSRMSVFVARRVDVSPTSETSL